MVDADLVVIGGGAAGIGAARAGRRRGASVALIEQGPIGGDCTFTGCIPSKALLEAAARGEGFDEAMSQVRRAVQTIAASESAPVIRAEGIDVIGGHARFTGRGTLDVDGRRVRAGACVVAPAPARPFRPSPASTPWGT